jgi:MFS family permease
MIKAAPASVRRNVADRKQPPVGGPFVLGRHASLSVSAGVVSHTLWTSAAPALTYGLYAQEWHLTHRVTAAIFAVYPIFVVVTLVGFGGISDQIGRRATMLAGLFASLAGALLFAVAPDVWWVFGGRALMGIGVGLAASPSTAAILEFTSPERAKRAALVTMVAQAIGFAAALLLGGALTEYGPWPTRLCFWILAVLLLILLTGTWFLPRHAAGGVVGRWRSRMPSVPKEVRRVFAVSSTAMMAAYTFGVLVLSLGGQVEHDLIGSANAFLNSAVLSLFPIAMGAIGIIARTLSPRVALIVGALVSGLAMVLLIVAVNFRDLVIYPAGDRRRRRRVQPAVCRRPASDQRSGAGASPRRYSLGALSAWLPVDGRARSRARRHRDNAGAWFCRQSRRGSDHLDECRHACTRHDDAIEHIPFRRSTFIHLTTTRTISLFQIGGDMPAPIGDLS